MQPSVIRIPFQRSSGYERTPQQKPERNQTHNNDKENQTPYPIIAMVALMGMPRMSHTFLLPFILFRYLLQRSERSAEDYNLPHTDHTQTNCSYFASSFLGRPLPF